MRLIAFVLLCSFRCLAAAAVTEAEYIAARDRYIAQFHDEPDASEDQALRDLEEKLRALIGMPGKSSLVTLKEGTIEFGAVDGLFLSRSLFVTTRSLMRRHLVKAK